MYPLGLRSSEGQLADLYEAIEIVYDARLRSLNLGDQTGAEASEQALHQLLNELYSRLGFSQADGSPSRTQPRPPGAV